MAIPGGFTTGQVLTAAEMNDLPAGVIAYSQTTATTSVVSNTALTVISLSATIVPDRRYRVTGRLTNQPSTGNAARHALYVVTTSSTKTLYYETNTVGANLPVTYLGSVIFTAAELGVTTGTGTSVTFDLKFIDSANNGGLSTNPDNQVGANSSVQQLVIEDVGTT
jgi:hypothetical protein